MSGNFLFVGLVVLVLVLGMVWVFGQSGVRGGDGAKYSDPEALARLLKEKTEPFVLVDVRTPEEYASGHIPGAVNIPYDTIAGNPPTKEKDSLVIVYCRSGNRSGIAKKTLDSLGYSRVENFGAVGRWRGEFKTGNNP